MKILRFTVKEPRFCGSFSFVSWKQRKLGDVVIVCSGKDYKHLGNANIPVYGTGGYMLSVSEALSYSDDAIGIGRKGTIDKPYILKASFWTVDTLSYAIPKEKETLNFVYYLFQIIAITCLGHITTVSRKRWCRSSMGIGIFAVWPLAKKFRKRNLTLFGFLLYAVGSAICWMAPTNMVIVLTGQFIKNIGGLPCAYVFMALFADGLDHVEWKSGIRCDDTAMSVYNIMAVAVVGIATAAFEPLKL